MILTGPNRVVFFFMMSHLVTKKAIAQRIKQVVLLLMF